MWMCFDLLAIGGSCFQLQRTQSHWHVYLVGCVFFVFFCFCIIYINGQIIKTRNHHMFGHDFIWNSYQRLSFQTRSMKKRREDSCSLEFHIYMAKNKRNNYLPAQIPNDIPSLPSIYFSSFKLVGGQSKQMYFCP